MDCPCIVCDKCYRKQYTMAKVALHFETFHRHPGQFGSSEGFEADKSNDEWDEHIARTQGVRQDWGPREEQLYEYAEMETMIMDALNWHHQFHGNFPAAEAAADFDDAREDFDWCGGPEQLAEQWGVYVAAMESARTPLFHNSDIPQLNGLVMLLSILETYNAPDALVSEVLPCLYLKLLPKPNTMPTSAYEAKKHLKRLGLAYVSIDACPNGCILYYRQEF